MSVTAADASLATERNVLDQYAQYQPYFRFFMVDEGPANRREIPPESAWAVLAETGGSALTTASIESVEITSFGGLDRDTGPGISTEFNFEMLQAFQAGTVLDEIYDQARARNIQQVRTIPMFLELTFRVRDPESQQPLGWEPLRGYRWVWPIILARTNMQITSQGTKYSFQAFYAGEEGRSREWGVTRHHIEITGVKTVGEFFTELAKQMTQPAGDRREAEKRLYKRNVTYEFRLEDGLAGLDLKPTHFETRDYLETRSDLNADEGEGDGNSNEGEYAFAFGPGTSVDQIMYDILSSLEDFQASVAGNLSSGPTRQGQVNQDVNKTKFKELFRIVSDVENGKWNPQLRDYDKTVIYRISRYEMSTALASANDPDIAPTQLSDYGGRLRRVYNYIFTGMNNAVLNFDIQFNFHWYLALPYQAGHYQQDQLGDLSVREKPSGNDQSRKDELPRDSSPTVAPRIDPVAHAIPASEPQQETVSGNVMRNQGRNFVSDLMDQAMSPTSGDLLNIELEIKGDPFWLEPDPMPNVEGPIPRPITRNREPGSINNNTQGNQTYFLFVARGAQPPGENGTFRAPSDVTLISGVYGVKKVIHTFRGSRFTQTLHAFRDLRFNHKNIQLDTSGEPIVRAPRPGGE